MYMLYVEKLRRTTGPFCSAGREHYEHFFNGTPVQLLMISILAHPLIEVKLKIGIPDVVLGGGTIFLALCPLLKVVHSSKVLLQLHLLLPTLS